MLQGHAMGEHFTPGLPVIMLPAWPGTDSSLGTSLMRWQSNRLAVTAVKV